MFFVLIFLSTKIALAQHPFNKEYLAENNDDASIEVFSQPFGYLQKATRFMPLFSFDGFDEWSSPDLLFENINSDYKLFPFNFATPDIVPFDLWSNQLEPGKSANEFNADKRKIKISSPVTGNNKIFFNTYLGSETGDPAIHVFTKPDNGVVNRNKIPISGVFGISGSHKDITHYRISFGYFGAYSTGSINDEMFTSFGYYYFGKLNKQFLGSADVRVNLGEGSSLLINTGLVSYYGWDVAPFLGSFTHFEIINSTIRAELTTPVKGFKVAVRRDEGIGKINLTSVTDPSEYSIKEFSVKPEYTFEKFGNNKHSIIPKIFSEVEFLSANNFELGSDLKHQNFFAEDIKEINFSVGGEAEYSSSWFNSKAEIIFDNHFTGEGSLSGILSIKNFSNSIVNDFTLTLSSMARQPNVTEIYGQYSFQRFVNGKLETFSIASNSDLKNERVNRVSLNYNPKHFMPQLQFELFYKVINNPIKQVPDRVVRLSFERDLLRNAMYLNSKQKSGYGAIINFTSEEYSFIKIIGKYRYLQNDDIEYSPKNKVDISTILSLPFKAKLTLNWQYSSKTIWEDFIVSPENDFLKMTGFDGRVGDVNTFNLYFDYSFIKFYFFEKLTARLSFTNIFNREVRYHPLGNRLDRAIVFSLAGNI
jgi:hypothetical protein